MTLLTLDLPSTAAPTVLSNADRHRPVSGIQERKTVMSTSSPTASSTPADEVRDFVRRFFEMANAHDFDRMPEFLHEEVIVNGTAVARDLVIGQFHGYSAAVPDLKWSIEDLVVENGRAAVRLSDTGTPVAPWLGLAPNGASVSFAETAFYEVLDGRLKSMTFLVDVDALKQQLAG